MTRVAVVSPFPPVRGGISHFAARASDALLSGGHEVVRCSFKRQYPDFLFPGRSQFEPGRMADPDALIDGTNPFSWMTAGRWLRDAKPDVVLAAYWTPILAPATGIVAGKAGAPVLALVHNARPHERIPGGDALARWFFGRCAGVLTLSNVVADHVRDLGFSGPLCTTPHPVYDRFGDAPARDEARRQLGLDPDAPVLLFFGLVRSYKGLDVLIEALAGVRRTAPSARLVVAGEWYEPREPVARRIAELGLQDAVRIDDAYVPDERVPALFSAADVVVLPYRSGTQSGVLETASAYGVPVVVTDVGALAAPVQEFGSGRVVLSGDSVALASAILEVIDPEKRPAYREGALRMASAHGWTPFVEAFEGLVGEVSGRAQRQEAR